MPIYKVDTPQGMRLVEAKSKTAAISFVVGSMVSAEPVTATDLHRFITKEGHTVEDATATDKAGSDDGAEDNKDDQGGEIEEEEEEAEEQANG